MIKRLVQLALLCTISIQAYAAKPTTFEAWERSMDALPTNQLRGPSVQSMAVTEEEVGDVDSFGKAKVYLGVDQTLPVFIQTDCTGWDPANGACIEPAAAPATTFVDEADMGSITLPANATDSIMCFTMTQFATWVWNNTTASSATGEMFLYITVQVENDSLIGLSDSNGVPFNGFLFPIEVPLIVSSHQHTLPAGASEIQRERSTRTCTGGIVNTRTLAGLGLTDPQIKDFFKEPMTVHFGIAGRVSLVEFASFAVGARLYGDK